MFVIINSIDDWYYIDNCNELLYFISPLAIYVYYETYRTFMCYDMFVTKPTCS